MVHDLSYLQDLASVPTDEQETLVRRAVEMECLRAISNYLGEVADTMEANSIASIDAPSLRAMSDQLNQRLETYNDQKQD